MIIGLTGGIASGKSTVANMLRKLQFPIVDADEVARQVVEPGKPALKEIIAAFGDDIVQENGEMNRQKLGNIIFNDEEKRRTLNGIIHPAIRQEMMRQREEWLHNGAETVIMDIPLLFEGNQKHTVDRILVVTVDEAIQLERLMNRNGFTEEEARARISSQLPLSEKVEGADGVIFNNGTIENTEQQLEKILREWQVI